MPKKCIAALILAAGSSSRMGASKQLLPFQETTLLGHVIENSQNSHVDEVYCILGNEADIIRVSISTYGIDIVINSNYKTGLSSSIVAGISHIKNKNFDAVLIVLGDQPLVNSNYINKMLEVFNESPSNVIASKYTNGLGVPVIIPAAYYNNLLELKGDKGAKEFLNSQNEVIIALESDSLFDVDTKEDYEELMKRLNKSN